jgi:DNA-binding phage protein
MNKAWKSVKPKKSPKNSKLPKGFQEWSPSDELLANAEIVGAVIGEAFVSGDRELFLETLQGWVSMLISKLPMEDIVKSTGLSRRTIYALMRGVGNPTADTVFSLVQAAKKAA